MAATPIDQNQTFYAPLFEIKLAGQNLRSAVVRDVTEVTYNDSLDKLDFFEFTLHDWDATRNEPKYSSPYDESGEPRKLADGSPAPSFDPGASVQLRMGYQGPEDPVLMLDGAIVSITPSFPASGVPTLKVRALSQLYQLQREQITREFEGKSDSDIARELGNDLDMRVEIPAGQESGEQVHEYMTLSNEYPINFLFGRARRLGYDLYVDTPADDGDPFLFFGRSQTAPQTFALQWGRSLVEFSLSVKVKGQVGKVTVRGWNGRERGSRREVVAEAVLGDLDLELPDPHLLDAIHGALAETEEVVVDDPIETQEEADAKAIGILREKAKDLITGRGTTVGFPALRAGRMVEIRGVGTRYSGRYLVTETTHRLDGNGYRTEFSARLEAPLS